MTAHQFWDTLILGIAIYAISEIAKKFDQIDISISDLKRNFGFIMEFYLFKFMPTFEVIVITYIWVLTMLTVMMNTIEFNFAFFMYCSLLTSVLACLAFIALKQRYIAEAVLNLLNRNDLK